MTMSKAYINGNMQIKGELVEYPLSLSGGRNLIDYTNTGSAGNPVVDDSKYLTEGKITYTHGALYSGITIQVPAVQPSKTYIFSYKYKKISGTLSAFGGHTLSTYENGVVYLDGVRRSQVYGASDSCFKANDTKVHTVDVIITTPATVDDSELLYIQPNRGNATAVTVEISDMKFEEVAVGTTKPTPWALSPTDIGHWDIPGWVKHFGTSFSENGLVCGEVIEVPTELFSSPNLVLNSDIPYTSDEYHITSYRLVESWVLGETYTVTIKGTINEGQYFGVWLNGAWANFTMYGMVPIGNNIYQYTGVVHEIPPTPIPKTMEIYNFPSATAKSANIEWIKLERGLPTPYSRALSEYSSTYTSTSNPGSAVGRNYLKDWSKMVFRGDTAGLGNSTLVDDDTGKYLKIEGTNNTSLSSYCWLTDLVPPDYDKTGERVLSMEVKSSIARTVKLSVRDNVSSYETFNRIIEIPADTWTTIRVPSTFTRTTDKAFVAVISTSNATIPLLVRDIKLEHGKVPTPWTPAPEDLGLSIPSWVNSFGNPLSINPKGIVISGKFSEYPHIIEKGLQRYYDFRGIANYSKDKGKVFDLSGNKNAGLLDKFGYTETSGYSKDGALVFDGVDDYVAITNLGGQDKVTYEFTVSKPSNNAYGTIISSSSQNATKGYTWMYFEGTNSFRVQFADGTAFKGISFNVPHVANEIFKVTATIDYVAKTIRVYKNGVFLESYTHSSNMLVPASSAGFIGNYNPTHPSKFTGKIYSLLVYNRVLSDEEIAYNYEAEKR